MILTIFAFVCIYGMKIMPFRKFNENYLSRETTTAVKGIFVFLVFMSHFAQYYPLGTNPSETYYHVRNYMGQLIVTMFLFYSGYGIFESIKKKGAGYVKQFPKNRILKTVVHLDVAILIYLVMDYFLNIKFKTADILLSLIGWSSVGNSNWFMFAIIVEYVIVFLAFTVFRKHKLPALITVTALTVIYMVVMSKYKDNYWFNTVLCLPCGLWYSYLKPGLEKAIMKNNFTYILFFLIFAAALVMARKHVKEFVYYEVWMLSFTALVVMFTMKVNICNKVLVWLGNHVFSIYILQRIPMTIFKRTGIVEFPSITVCFFVCFAITAVLAAVFDKITGAADKKLFKPAKTS